MPNKKETFASILKLFEYRYDTRTVFDDFLTMTICAFSQKPAIGKSYDEDLYLSTVSKYANDKLRFEFPKLLACLSMEMEDRYGSVGEGNDVLGEYYEQHLYRKGASQYFTPWPICYFMASCTFEANASNETHEPLRILDPTCGSGRMLLASGQINGPQHEYYGIDIDPVCVKMAAINLFLNGLFHSEVMCADALNPASFKESYAISFLPFGIFRITEKEKSKMWYMNQYSFEKIKTSPADVTWNGNTYTGGSQLTIF